MGEKGLYVKYDVKKAGTDEVVSDCFVLRPDRDPAAIDALIAYAEATENDALAKDISEWVARVCTNNVYPGEWDLYLVNSSDYIIAKSAHDAAEFYEEVYKYEKSIGIKVKIELIPRNKQVYLQRPERGEDVWWFELFKGSALIEQTNVYRYFLANRTSEEKPFCVHSIDT